MAASIYAIGIGSNRRGRHGAPAAEVRAAVAALGDTIATSPIVASAPLGPSSRRFANAAVLIESEEAPSALLARLKAIEADFGRRSGRRWGARVIDLDILLWSEGAWGSPALTLPHRDYRRRRFVLAPLAAIAPDWRDPLTGRTTRQLLHAIDRPRPRP
ncbi:2-amino-4-hydroxy-6-hydroxymethyldihydropteridine diphosphokinase [Sphingomonas sp. GC_Shp_1]|uniref:2-amino-4-hydroxy-6- hydroxymethyldihydropteridine diphosphokinase n=1 Tax=unclassified Sphingomonas TaxID=196159 RepID=UPI00226AD4DC